MASGCSVASREHSRNHPRIRRPRAEDETELHDTVQETCKGVLPAQPVLYSI